MSVTGEQNDKKKEGVTIKGTSAGLLIRLRDDPEAPAFTELLAELETRLTSSSQFFRKGHISVDLGKLELEADNLEALKTLLAKNEVNLESIVSGANSTRSAAKQVGVPIHLPSKATTRAPFPEESDGTNGVFPFDSAEALFLKRNLLGGTPGRICP